MEKTRSFLLISILSTLSFTLIGCNKEPIDSSKEEEKKNEEFITSWLDRLSKNILLDGEIQGTGKIKIDSNDTDSDSNTSDIINNLNGSDLTIKMNAKEAYSDQDEESKAKYYQECKLTQPFSFDLPSIYIFNDEGKAVSQERTLNNIIKDTQLKKDDKDISFDEYLNPFKSYSVNDFEVIDEYSFKLKDSSSLIKLIPSSINDYIDLTKEVTFNSNLFTLKSTNSLDLSFDCVASNDIKISANFVVYVNKGVAYNLSPYSKSNDDVYSYMEPFLNKVKSIKNFTYEVGKKISIKTKDIPLPLSTSSTSIVKYLEDGYCQYPSESFSYLTGLDDYKDIIDLFLGSTTKGSGIHKYNDNKFYKYTFEEVKDDQNQESYKVEKGDEVTDFETNRGNYCPEFSDISVDVFKFKNKSSSGLIKDYYYNFELKDMALNRLLLLKVSQDSQNKITNGVSNSPIVLQFINKSKKDEPLIDKLKYTTSITYDGVTISLETSFKIKDISNTVIDEFNFE